MPIQNRSILEEAQELIHGERQKTYGNPLDDFSRTGRMWGALLKIPDIPAETVALMMAALKMSRLCNTPNHRDSLVDLAGYAGADEMVIAERERRKQSGEVVHFIDPILARMADEPDA
jgi:hypothetical protein